MNRHTRDELLQTALNMVDNPSLDAIDRPDGVIRSERALCVEWLQQGLDYFHAKWPFATTLAEGPLTFTAGTATYALPADFVLDYKDGIVLANDLGRLARRGLDYMLSRLQGQRACPKRYAIVGVNHARVLRVYPVPDTTYTATLYYYSLPVVLGPKDTPVFPSDWILTEYIRLRGKEWTGALPPGSALKYANEMIGDMQRAGHGSEAEPDQIPIDTEYAGMQSMDDNRWMGDPVPR